MSKNQKKNARKRQKKKEKKESEVAFEIEEVIEGFQKTTLTDPVDETSAPPPLAPPLISDTHVAPDDKDVIKRIRGLRKKLKQIEELERRITSGDIIKPDSDQRNKISKKDEILEELKTLTDISS